MRSKMRPALFALLLPLTPLLLTACSDSFPDEEMHLGLEDKIRPYAITLEPPEASPGETVQVTLHAHVPPGKSVDIHWQVALDYDNGLYEADEIERQVLPVGQNAQSAYSGTMLRQWFTWTVPDSVARVSSAVPDVLTDPVLVALAQLVVGPDAGDPPTRAGVETWLASRDPSVPLSPEEEALVDRFSCAVRFRATMETRDRAVDVTRNLTVRHSRRLGSTQVNTNNTENSRLVVALEKADARSADLEDPAVVAHEYPLVPAQPPVPQTIPFHPDWTYFLVESFALQDYNAPFEPGLVVSEELEGRWYYYRHDDPAAPEAFLRNDEGEEPEMWELDYPIILAPAGPDTRYFLVSVMRDLRRDWVQYFLTPGASVYPSEIQFVTP
ncbi:hypothetical protein CSB20_14080 [bacterium DOLZORAL124_64_63]|nr:MAG: hypothetical protein CSB20_14080 [bacterium DOLZORAL124_64_63]